MSATNGRAALLESYGRWYGEQHLAVAFTAGTTGQDAKRVTSKGWDKTLPLADGGYGASYVAGRGGAKNPAIVLRPSNLIVLECDSAQDLERIDALDLPATVTVQSSEPFKRHYWFRPPPELEALPFVAFRFESGKLTADTGRYFLAPPSLHPSGSTYAFLPDHGPNQTAIATLPEPIYQQLSQQARAETSAQREQIAVDPEAKIRAGNRRDLIFRYACMLRRWGVPRQQILEQCLHFNDTRCDPPVDRYLVEVQVDGAMKKRGSQEIEAATQWAPVDPSTAFPPPLDDEPEAFPEAPPSFEITEVPSDVPASERLSLRNLASYTIRKVEWLDKPFLQRSAFHLLAGRKGSCKGTMLCGIGAQVTTGELYGEPKRVLVITSEDSIELDFLPRLVAAAGNPLLVEIVNGPFLMPNDLPWLAEQAQKLGNVGLIVIDPIGNHLGGKDTDKEGLVRLAISPLNDMADELDTMIFGVRHLGKDASRGALSSILGSTAWADVPREVILMAADDQDDMLFHAQVVAGNRGPRSNSGRAYRLNLIDVPPAAEITLTIPEGASNKNVEDLLAGTTSAPTSKSSQAKDLILSILEQGGEHESDELDAQIAEQIGIAAKTTRNLRSELSKNGLISVRPVKDDNGVVERWLVRRTLAPRDDPE